MILWILACSGSDADVSTLPKVDNPPVVPPVGSAVPVVAPPRPDAPADLPSGTSWPLDGAPGSTAENVSLFVGQHREPVIEEIDGATGVVLRAAPGETQLFCTQFTPATAPMVVKARTKVVTTCTIAGCKLPAVQLRSFGADNKPVGPPSRIGGLGAAGAWSVGQWSATPLPNATQVRICFNVPEGDAVVAVDWIAI